MKKKIYIYIFFYNILFWTKTNWRYWNKPFWKIPYNASKRIMGFDSLRLFQESTITMKWHKKYIE